VDVTDESIAHAVELVIAARGLTPPATLDVAASTEDSQAPTLPRAGYDRRADGIPIYRDD
jgi:hypothetical protein